MIVPASMTQENTTYHIQPGTSSATGGMLVDGQGKEVEKAETICMNREIIALSPMSEHSMVSQDKDVEKETVKIEENKNNNQHSDHGNEGREHEKQKKIRVQG